MDLSGRKVALLVDNYFEQAKLEEPLKALKKQGADVTIISSAGKELRGLRHTKIGDAFTADALLDEARPEDYEALVLPGGAMNADKLRMVDAARDWVRHFLDNGKPLAVICHAPWVLVSADAVKGRHLTSYYTIQDDIRNAQGNWIDQEVVVDNTLITSRQPDDIPAFNRALMTMIAERSPAPAL